MWEGKFDSEQFAPQVNASQDDVFSENVDPKNGEVFSREELSSVVTQYMRQRDHSSTVINETSEHYYDDDGNLATTADSDNIGLILDPDIFDSESYGNKIETKKIIDALEARHWGQEEVRAFLDLIQTAMEVWGKDRNVAQHYNFKFFDLVQRTKSVEMAQTVAAISVEWAKAISEETLPIQQPELFLDDLIDWYEQASTDAKRPMSADEVRQYISRIRDLYSSPILNQIQGGTTSEILKRSATLAVYRHRDAAIADRLESFISDIQSKPIPASTKIDLYWVVGNFARSYGLNEENVAGLTTSLVPALLRNDADAQGLVDAHGGWGASPKDPGTADFVANCYARQVTPSNLERLVRLQRLVPTSQFASLEQNRLDGITIGGSLRDIIHGNKAGLHQLVTAIITYYETGDSTPLKTTAQWDLLNERDQQDLLNQQYETSVRQATSEDELDYRSGGYIKLIDILRRIEVNTRPISIEPPEVSDSHVQQFLKIYLEAMKEKDVFGRLESITTTLQSINADIEARIDRTELGISPNMIEAYSWLEHQAAVLVRSIPFEAQMGMYESAWLLELMKFHELTGTIGSFDSKEFSEFTQKLRQSTEDVSRKSLFDRLIKQVSDLTETYRLQRYDPRMVWSGNLTAELLALQSPHKAQTPIGERFRNESIRRDQLDPSYHPGD
ncbi:MAG: hypothetical protein AAB647_03460 [Patescibacteria group bacterium]